MVGGIEYTNSTIDAIYHAEGRAVLDGSTWDHEYVITDHLGNTRVRFHDDNGNGTISSGELLSTHDYYPFGMEWNASSYQYTYNGKEIDDELGLEWFHYGARMYDPVIARFTGVDPISDEFPWVSTYNYAENEPIANIDLHGLQKQNQTQSENFSSLMRSINTDGLKTAIREFFNFKSLIRGGDNEKSQTLDRINDVKVEGERLDALVDEGIDKADNIAKNVENVADVAEGVFLAATALTGGTSSPVTVPGAAISGAVGDVATGFRVGLAYAKDGEISPQMLSELALGGVFRTTTKIVDDKIDNLNISGNGAKQTENAVKAINQGVQKAGESAADKIIKNNE